MNKKTLERLIQMGLDPNKPISKAELFQLEGMRTASLPQAVKKTEEVVNTPSKTPRNALVSLEDSSETVKVAEARVSNESSTDRDSKETEAKSQPEKKRRGRPRKESEDK